MSHQKFIRWLGIPLYILWAFSSLKNAQLLWTLPVFGILGPAYFFIWLNLSLTGKDRSKNSVVIPASIGTGVWSIFHTLVLLELMSPEQAGNNSLASLYFVWIMACLMLLYVPNIPTKR